MSDMPIYDVVIIGGGINGCGCAADAALRGLSVLLCEQGDLACQTSSSSSKLIHGGLRYLEQFHLSLVKKALTERQRLITLAPHLVRPLALVVPHEQTMRPLWLLRLGLFLYDHLNKNNRLPHSRFIRRLQNLSFFSPLKNRFKQGFIFYDAITDDARLTITNAIQAEKHGATILTQTTFIKATVHNHLWQLTFQTNQGTSFQVIAKSVINAAGPWIDTVNEQLRIPLDHAISRIKGSHIVVAKLYDGNHAYVLQHDDKRIVFVVPYYGHTMIGTTDVPVNDMNNTSIESAEIDYLLTIIARYFNQQLEKKDIIHSWSGVRCLLASNTKNPSQLSREYAYYTANTPAPSVTIYSGKMTTYRQLASEVIDQLRMIFKQLPSSLTAITPLPGAVLDTMNFQAYTIYATQKYHWLDEATRQRYLISYGTQTEQLLANCLTIQDLGRCFAPTLYQIEIDYLIREEWATNSDDILFRRTKLGLSIQPAQAVALENYITHNR